MLPTPPPADPRLSIVIPVYNEVESLEVLSEEILAALTGEASYEVIFVDDGSTDGSAETLARLAARHPQIRSVVLAVNRGQSAALGRGLRVARGAVVVTLDGDLQNDPADIPAVVAALGDEWDLVSGVRAHRRDSWSRRVASRVANRVRNWLLRDGLSDVGCSLKAYRAEVLADIPIFDGMHRFLPALVHLNGARITEMPVRHRARQFGTSKYDIAGRLWRGLADLYGVWWLRRRWLGRRAERR